MIAPTKSWVVRNRPFLIVSILYFVFYLTGAAAHGRTRFLKYSDGTEDYAVQLFLTETFRTGVGIHFWTAAYVGLFFLYRKFRKTALGIIAGLSVLSLVYGFLMAYVVFLFG